MAASRTLSELVVVREWLHDTAPPPPRPDASTGYWRFTKHRVTQGRWTGNTGRTAENVVREMDPDAVVREAEIGRSLAGDDAVRGGFLASYSWAWAGSSFFLLLLELRQGVVAHAVCVCARWEHRRRGQTLSRCASTMACGEHPRLSSLLVARNL
jgi:hypothetical protein